MVEFVREYGVALAGQRLHHAEVGHVAGGKQQRGWLADESGELLFELVMRLEMPAHQMRRTGADAPLLRTLLQRAYQLRMLGQTEVVVAAEGKIALAVHDDMRRLRRFQRAAAAQQPKRRALIQLALQCSKWHQCLSMSGYRPSFFISARSRSTSGLPVVSNWSP